MGVAKLHDELKLSVETGDIAEIERVVLKLHHVLTNSTSSEARSQVEQLILEGEQQYLRLYRICKPYLKRLRQSVRSQKVRAVVDCLTDVERAGKHVVQSMRHDVQHAEMFLKKSSQASRAAKELFTTNDSVVVREFLLTFCDVLPQSVTKELEDLISSLEIAKDSPVTLPDDLRPRRAVGQLDQSSTGLGRNMPSEALRSFPPLRCQNDLSISSVISDVLHEAEAIVNEERRTRLRIYKMELFAASAIDTVVDPKCRESILRYQFLAASMKQRLATQVVLQYDSQSRSVQSNMVSPIKAVDCSTSTVESYGDPIPLHDRVVPRLMRSETQRRQAIEEVESFNRVVELTPVAGRLALLNRVKTMTSKNKSNLVFEYDLRSPSPV